MNYARLRHRTLADTSFSTQLRWKAELAKTRKASRQSFEPWIRGLSVCPSICPSVRSSVTRRYYTKTARPRITQTMSNYSSGTLVLSCQRSRRNSNGGATNWAPNKDGVSYNGQLSNFRPISRDISESVQDKDIVIMER